MARLVNFQPYNQWFRIMLKRLTEESPIDHQISFWRMKFMKPGKSGLDSKKQIRLIKFVQIVDELMKKEKIRGFFQIEKYREGLSYYKTSHLWDSKTPGNDSFEKPPRNEPWRNEPSIDSKSRGAKSQGLGKKVGTGSYKYYEQIVCKYTPSNKNSVENNSDLKSRNNKY